MSGNANSSLKKFILISIVAAFATILLKTLAWQMTGSVGLLSDALESVVNLAAAVIALVLLSLSQRPADKKHPFGHTKAEYFSSAIEGGLIILAAGSIAWSAIPKIIDPTPIENVGWGLLVSISASLINLVVAIVLIRNGKKHKSIILEADGKHLMTDVWTSVGVVLGILLVKITGWLIFDGIIALAVALNIIVSGFLLIRRSAQGLMDISIDETDNQKLEEILNNYRKMGVGFRDIKTRQAGQRFFITFTVLVPGAWPVKQGHELLEKIESEVGGIFSQQVSVITHLEPVEDING